MEGKNRQIILASRPKGMVEEKNFKLVETTIPEPKEGEVLIKALYLTVDPYMRGRMNDRPSYNPPFQLNKPPTGGVVGKIVESKNSEYKVGDLVQGFLEWSEYSVTDGSGLQKLDPSLAPISTALGVLGMPGMTAYFGLLDIGQPKANETVVISAAAGAVGMLVGQIAKIKGCYVVGIAGDDEKVKYLTESLHFDAAINYKKSNVYQELKKVCPRGVDIYFDNVGGDISDKVLMLINKYARIVLCGQISMYNLDKPDLGPRNNWLLLTNSAMMKGFIVSDFFNKYPEGVHQMGQWIKSGKIKYKENIINGFENIPQAFLGLFQGENIGKQIVKVADS